MCLHVDIWRKRSVATAPSTLTQRSHLPVELTNAHLACICHQNDPRSTIPMGAAADHGRPISPIRRNGA